MRLTLDTVITILIVLVGLFFGWSLPESPEANSVFAMEPETGTQLSELDESFFYGTWSGKTCAGTFYTTLFADGTTSTRLVRKNSEESVHISSGSWELRDNAIVWIHSRDTSRTKAGTEDVNPIIKVEKNRVKLREVNGTVTTLTRVSE